MLVIMLLKEMEDPINGADILNGHVFESRYGDTLVSSYTYPHILIYFVI